MSSWFIHEKINGHSNGYWEVMYATEKPQLGELVRVENRNSGYHYHTITEEDEIIYSTWDEILKDYFLKQSDSLYGWIDREGRFYGCDFTEHRLCAEVCFDLTEIEAENRGYIKIFNVYGADEQEYYCSKKMTIAQKRTLEEHGFLVDDYEVAWNE